MSTINHSQRVTPFLWFDKEAEEAMNLYTSVFPNSKITQLKKWPEGGPLPAGTVQSGTFLLDGVQFHAFDAGPQFIFNEAISFFVTCKDQEEIDYYWEKLTAGGGSPGNCGWLKDKFDVSWQIVPQYVADKVKNGEPGRVGQMMQALAGMGKLVIADLEKAYQQ